MKKKKVLGLAIFFIFVIIGVASLYYLFILTSNGQMGDEYQPTLTAEDVIEINMESQDIETGLGSKVIEASAYDIHYSTNDRIEQNPEYFLTCYAQRMTFIDSNSAEEQFQLTYAKFIETNSNKENLKIYQFEGCGYIIIHVDSKREYGYGILVRNENQLIYLVGTSFDKATAIKVCEWIIQNI